jgi:hypothetical protein
MQRAVTRRFGFVSAIATSACLLSAAACSHPARLTIFDYTMRPAGYHWAAHRIRASKDLEYYGVDPRNGWTVYVGPDGIYYTFSHAPPITERDLRSYWTPHDAPRPAATGADRPTPK